MSKARSFCFTINNWSDDDVKFLDDIECKYLVYGKEVGEQGTPHLQGYISFANARSVKGIVKVLRGHVEVANGSGDQNRIYCVKDGDYFEKGTRPKQGKRNDLVKVKDSILAGVKVDSIVLDDPMMYHQYGRTLNKIEDLRMRSVFRTEMTAGIWYYGPTGVGKSHKAFEGYTPQTHYVVPDDNGWWDGYCQQDIVIFNDFRGEVSYNFMLQLVDKWPMMVKRRNREPMPFVSKTVIVTSSLAPEHLFRRREEEDSLDQLRRRFVVCPLGTEVVEGNNSFDCSTFDCSYCFLAGKVSCSCN